MNKYNHQKIPLAMRVTLIYLCLIAFQLQAEMCIHKNENFAGYEKYDHRKSIANHRRKIRLYFLYNNKLVNVDRKVSVRVKNAAISD
jgi:hypothetical protein